MALIFAKKLFRLIKRLINLLCNNCDYLKYFPHIKLLVFIEKKVKRWKKFYFLREIFLTIFVNQLNYHKMHDLYIYILFIIFNDEDTFVRKKYEKSR